MRPISRLVLFLCVVFLTSSSASAQEDEPLDEAQAEPAQEESADTPGSEEESADAGDAEDPFEEFEQIGRDDFGDDSGFRSGETLQLMSRQELENAGFDFGTEADSVDNFSAFIIATTGGLVVHGLGHFYLGDPRTGFFLLGMQAVSLGLITSSAVYYGLTGGASTAAAFFAPALQLGLAGFVFSYFVDIVGSLWGGTVDMPPNSSIPRGVGVRARYGFLNSVGLPLRHVIDGQLMGDFGGFYGHVATTQDVFLDGASYRGRVGVRPFRGVDPLTFVSVEAGGEYFLWQGVGEFGRIAADGRIGGSYQLGRAYPHVDQFAFGAEVGLGNYWYQLAARDGTTFEIVATSLWIPFDVYTSMNISRKLNFRGGYGSPALSLLTPSHRMLGVGHMEFTYRSSSIGDISLRTEIGDGIALYLGGSLWFGR